MDEAIIPILIVSIATWLSPMPQHAEGLLVTYGSQEIVEANAAYRGYDLSYYPNRCGVSAISPSDLGEIVWLRVEGSKWFGPCLTIDVGARRDFYRLVYVNREIAEVPRWMAKLFKFRYGSSRWGEVYKGLCPPRIESQPEIYRPDLVMAELGPNPVFRRFPRQQLPIDCERREGYKAE